MMIEHVDIFGLLCEFTGMKRTEVGWYGDMLTGFVWFLLANLMGNGNPCKAR